MDALPGARPAHITGRPEDGLLNSWHSRRGGTERERAAQRGREREEAGRARAKRRGNETGGTKRERPGPLVFIRRGERRRFSLSVARASECSKAPRRAFPHRSALCCGCCCSADGLARRQPVAAAHRFTRTGCRCRLGWTRPGETFVADLCVE